MDNLGCSCSVDEEHLGCLKKSRNEGENPVQCLNFVPGESLNHYYQDCRDFCQTYTERCCDHDLAYQKCEDGGYCCPSPDIGQSSSHSELNRVGHKRSRSCIHCSSLFHVVDCSSTMNGCGATRKRNIQDFSLPPRQSFWTFYRNEVYHFLHHSITTFLLMRSCPTTEDEDALFWKNNRCSKANFDFLRLWKRVVGELHQILLQMCQSVAEGSVAPEDNFECTSGWHPITTLFLKEFCGFCDPTLHSTDRHLQLEEEQPLEEKLPCQFMEHDFSCCRTSSLPFAAALSENPPALIGFSLVEDDDVLVMQCQMVSTPLRECFPALRSIPVISRIGIFRWILMAFLMEIDKRKICPLPLATIFHPSPRKLTYRVLLVSWDEQTSNFCASKSCLETKQSEYQSFRSLLHRMKTFMSQQEVNSQSPADEARIILYTDLPFSKDGPDENLFSLPSKASGSDEPIHSDIAGRIQCEWQDLCRSAGGKPKTVRHLSRGSSETSDINMYLGCFALLYNPTGDCLNTPFQCLPCGDRSLTGDVIIQTLLITSSPLLAPLLLIQAHWPTQSAETFLTEKERLDSHKLVEWECSARWLYRLLSSPVNIMLTEWHPVQFDEESIHSSEMPSSRLLELLINQLGESYDKGRIQHHLFVHCPSLQHCINDAYQGKHIFTRGLRLVPSRDFVNPLSESTQVEPWRTSSLSVETDNSYN